MSDGQEPTGLSFEASGQAQDATQAQAAAGQEQSAPDFFSFVPEELKGAPWMEKYKTPEEFFKGVDNLQKLAGQKSAGIVRPADDAPPEAWDEFYQKLGVPQKPEEYGLKVDAKFKDLFLEGDDKFVTKLFHDAKLTPDQASKLLPAYLEFRSGQVEQMKAAQAEAYKSGEAALKQSWGPKYEDNLKAAAQGLDKAGVLEEFERQGLGNNPAVLQLGEILNRALGEDYVREGASMSTRSSVESMRKELDILTADPGFGRDAALREKAFELSAKIQKAMNKGHATSGVPEFSAR